MPGGDGTDNQSMPRSLSQTDPLRPEDLSFQMSLLRLLYPSKSLSPQVVELEGLLTSPANFVPAHSFLTNLRPDGLGL